MYVKLACERDVIVHFGAFPAISHCLTLLPELCWFCMFNWTCSYILFSGARAKTQRTSAEVNNVTLGLHWLTEVRIKLKFLSTEKTPNFCFSCNVILRKNDLSNFQWLIFAFSAFRSFYPLLAVLSILFSPPCLYFKILSFFTDLYLNAKWETVKLWWAYASFWSTWALCHKLHAAELDCWVWRAPCSLRWVWM